MFCNKICYTFEILKILQLCSQNDYFRLLVCYLLTSISSAIVRNPFLQEFLLKEKGGITFKPLTSGIKLNGFPGSILPSHLSVYASLHQGCFLSWSAVKHDQIGGDLLINNTWPVRETPPPHPVPTSSSVFHTSPLTLTCSTFSLSSAVLHPVTFLSSNHPPSFV